MATLVITAAVSLSGCSKNSRVSVTSPIGFQSDGFLQSDLAGRWSGTLEFDGHAYTVYIDVDFDGDIDDGFESDFDDIVDGFFDLDNGDTGAVDIQYITDTGVLVFAEGFLAIGANQIEADFSSSEGFDGELRLQRTFGPGTFDITFIQAHYDVEFTNVFYDITDVGEIDIIFDGFVEIGDTIGGDQIFNGQFTIVDSETGEFSAFIDYVSGESVQINGLISAADRTLSGVRVSTAGDSGLCSFFFDPFP